MSISIQAFTGVVEKNNLVCVCEDDLLLSFYLFVFWLAFFFLFFEHVALGVCAR